MCNTCEREDDLVELLRRAKEDRSLITDELLDVLIEHVEEGQDQRLDRMYSRD
jgi:hypothetical protein